MLYLEFLNRLPVEFALELGNSVLLYFNVGGLLLEHTFLGLDSVLKVNAAGFEFLDCFLNRESWEFVYNQNA